MTCQTTQKDNQILLDGERVIGQAALLVAGHHRQLIHQSGAQDATAGSVRTNAVVPAPTNQLP